MGTIAIDIDDTVVSEKDGYAEFIVHLSSPSSSTVTVEYQTRDGGATNGVDYASSSGSLSFAPGETEKRLRVRVIDDTVTETNESFSLALFSATDADVGKGSAVATIADNDGVPGTPVISISDPVVDGKSGLATFTIALDRPSAGVVSMNYATQDGSADAADFSATSGTLTFAAGQTVRTVSVAITDDTTREIGETFDLVLSGVSGATLPDAGATATIGASDQTAVTRPVIDIDDAVASEKDGYVEFLVHLSAPCASTVSVEFHTGDGSAINGVDYASTSGLLSFGAGETVKTLRVSVTDDSVTETSESFALKLFSPTGADVGKGTAVATIADNDGPTGTPVISVSDPVVDEKSGFATFTLSLDRPSTGVVSVKYATQVGSAGASDFSTTSGALTFAAGQTVRTVSVAIADDATRETGETFDLVLSGVSGATLPDTTGTATIGASDQLQVSRPIIDIDDAVVSEEDGYAEFIVHLSAPSASTVSVEYQTGDGSAVNGVDYASTSGSLSFGTGETVKTLRVPVTDDTAIENREGFRLLLFSATNADIGKSTAVATVVDNDETPGKPVISISDPVVDEKSGLARFTVSLDRPSTSAVSVQYTTRARSASAADISATTGMLSFGAGETVRTVSVVITDDLAAESNESFDLVLSGALGATLKDTVGTATIGASDQSVVSRPVIDIDDAVVSEKDGFADFVVHLTAPSASTVSVQYQTGDGSASNGVDYASVSGVLSFGAGETVKTLRVAVSDDTKAEATESLRLVLYSSKNGDIGKGTAIATIVDNDGATGTPVMSISDAQVDEKSGSATFTVSLDRPSKGLVAVNYATQAGSAGVGDFSATSGVLDFVAGQTVRTVSVSILDDTTAEVGEAFNLVLSGVAGAILPASVGTATIGASDLRAVSRPVVHADDVVVSETDKFADFVVRLSAPSATTVSLQYQTGDGSAHNGSDYTPISGNLSFAAGETVKTLRVAMTDDTIAETDESFSLLLYQAINADIGTSKATGTIVDNENHFAVLDYGASDDIYVVSNSDTVILEKADGGIDLVKSSASFVLSSNVENLTLTGASVINGTGNALANVLIGNGADNKLAGGGGNDSLNGAAGADTMVGGTGNDIYTVDNAQDVVAEAANGGTDLVRSAIAHTLGANVENLVLGGVANIRGTGNSLGNKVVGNAGKNIIDGGAGNDTLTGLGGADTFVFSTPLNATSNLDRITDFDVPADTIDLARAIFTTLSGGVLAPNAFYVGPAAHDADDRIVYNSATGALSYDSNGNAAGGATQFATLSGGLAITNADFAVV